MPRTVTYSNVVLADVKMLVFARGSDGIWRLQAQATVSADDGTSYQASFARQITPGQQTQIENFITNNVIGALNTQEGMV